MSQGTSALRVTPNGYTEIASIAVPAPGFPIEELTLDLRLPQALSWGEVRVVLIVPSQQLWWEDLGGHPLAGETPGVYHTFSYPLSAPLQSVLSGTVSDLEIRVILNVPWGSGNYLLDNLSFGSEELPGDVLLVVGDTQLSPTDVALRDRLEGTGYEPFIVDDDEVTSGNTWNKRLIVISESSSPVTIGTKLRDVPVPVLSMDPIGWGNMNMAPDEQHWDNTVGEAADQRFLDIGSTPSGLITAFPEGSLQVTWQGESFGWATPSSSDALIAATLFGEPDKAAIFGYVKGAAMEGGVKAAHRRVGFFAGRDAPASFTPEGWQLFDSAVAWATFQTTSNAALLVVADVPLASADKAVMHRLGGLGLGVELVTDDAVTTAHANGKRLVAVSESVTSALVGDTFRDVPVPVISWEPVIWADMKMAGSASPWNNLIGDALDQTEIVVGGGHPLTAGLDGAVQATSAGDKYFWAKPNSPNAIVAATLAGDPTKATLFGYEMGTAMEDSFVAPHRRVGLFAGEGAPDIFTGPGWWLFDAAVTWAIAPQALLVIDVGSDAAPVDDAALTARLEGLGYHVRTKAGASVQAHDADGMNLIVISESTKSVEVGTRLTNVKVPIVNLEMALQDELGMTSPTDQGLVDNETEIGISDPEHPLAAGLDGTVVVTTTGQNVAWGIPSSEASIAATISSNPSQATVYGYEAGAQMVGLTAPAARVFLFPTRHSPTAFTDAGWALFEAAVRWQRSPTQGRARAAVTKRRWQRSPTQARARAAVTLER